MWAHSRLALVIYFVSTTLVYMYFFQINRVDFRVVNMSGIANVFVPINLEQMARQHPDETWWMWCRFRFVFLIHSWCSYCSEFHHSLVYRKILSHVTSFSAQVFVSGKLIVRGVKNKKEIEQALEHMSVILERFKKKGVRSWDKGFVDTAFVCLLDSFKKIIERNDKWQR